MNIDWQHYHAPNKEAIKEIPSQLDYLFSANDSPENIEYSLYNELAPNIKHQFKIYNVIVPIIEVIEFNILAKGKTQYKNEILNFFGYIFQEFIRDENSILIPPIEYQFAAPKLSSQYSDEFKFYKRFQSFVKSVFPDNIETITNLGFCINGMEFDKELALTSLSTPKQQSFVWGNGYECVLATSALMIDSLHKDARYQKNTINHIMNGYDTIRKINIDEDFNFPPHKFMLEDLSSILFHEYLGKGILIDKKMLTEAQLYFYNLMTEEFRTHTYSLLYAGIMPKGLSIESANNIDDIYNCYN